MAYCLWVWFYKKMIKENLFLIFLAWENADKILNEVFPLDKSFSSVIGLIILLVFHRTKQIQLKIIFCN